MATKLATYECAYCSTVFRSESSVCPHCGAVVAAPFFSGPDWVAALRRSDRERSN